MKINLVIVTLLATQLCVNASESNAEWRDTIAGKRLENVVVTGTKVATPLSQIPNTVTVIGNETIEDSYQPSLLPVLNEHVPGLFITGRGVMGYGVSTGGSGGMKMRGVGGEPSTGMLVLIDGNPQYMGLMGHPIADAYQSMLADRVEVVRGPASVVYGSNAMGGVINIITRKDKREGVYTKLRAGYGSYNTLATELMNTVKINRFSSVITGSYNRTDGHRKDMGFEQYGGYAKIGYELSDNWRTYGELNITHFNASNPGTVTAHINDNDSRITRGMAGVALENKYDKLSGAVKFFYNWGRHKINDGYAYGELPLDYRFNSKDYMMGVNIFERISLFTGNNITLGFDYTRFGGRAWNKFVTDGSETTLRDTTQHEIAGYVNMSQQLVPWINLSAGLRYDYHSQCGGEWIPQGGVTMMLPHRSELKMSVAKGFRFPTIREMYMFPPQNPDLKPESIVNYEISFSQWLLNNKMNYGMNVFMIDGKNIIQTVRTDGRPRNLNTGKIKNWGIELTASYHVNKHWTVASNYSFLHMKYPVIAAPKHKWNINASYSVAKWNFATDIMLVKDLFTSVSPVDKDNYILMNLRADYSVNRYVKIFAKGENLFAQKYEINKGYPMPKATAMFGVEIAM